MPPIWWRVKTLVNIPKNFQTIDCRRVVIFHPPSQHLRRVVFDPPEHFGAMGETLPLGKSRTLEPDTLDAGGLGEEL